MKTVNLPVPIIVAAAVLLVSGCFMTLEERWQAFDKKMRQEGGGSILNISTVGGLKAIPGFEGHAYQAAKAGVIMLTKTVAVHYAKQNIRCNCICPAGVITPPVADMLKDPQAKAWFEGMHPTGRLGQPEEVAEATVYFASDESRWTTGSILSVDGGVMAA